MSARAGASLIELIVAMTVFTIGLLGLAAVAAVAQRSFTTAAAIERGADAAAYVMDSLLRVPAPASGELAFGDIHIHWLIAYDSTAIDVRLTAAVPGARAYTYQTVHSARAR